MRKPEPLSSDFKNIVDEITGVMMQLEIYEGKDCMYANTFSKQLSGTAPSSMK